MKLLASQQNHELILTPHRVFVPKSLNRYDQIAGVSWLTDSLGPEGVILQRFQPVPVKPAFPAIERLGTDAEMPAGQPRVPPVRHIEIKPLKS